MCTLTWRPTATGCEVFFSRDESLARPQALPPRWTGDALMPIDPQGGGTWLAVNLAGITFALLNGYEWSTEQPIGDSSEANSGTTAQVKLVSRGTLIPKLIDCNSEQAVDAALGAQVGPHFAPFRLCLILPNGQASQWCWRNGQLERAAAEVPIVSSGVLTEQVLAVRFEALQHCEGDLALFHRSHHPHKGFSSVCMHRDEAKTVSLSHIQVDQDKVKFGYQPGSPCDNQPWHYAQFKRQLEPG